MVSHTWRRAWRRPPVDDAYTAWLDAHGPCEEALAAWRAAAAGTRVAAYSAYLAELQLEENAAVELERLQPPSIAA